ncbi:MAG: hypothetical protein JWP97_3804 [Labilithrix sp.]|nr:hypothetical protein [Labilithrix sp.]
MENPKRRTTQPGLGAVGDSGLRPKHGSTSPPASGVTSRRPRSRNPVCVDEVGDVAVRLGAKHGRAIAAHAPRMLRERRELESAPIDHRDAFVLSLVDGATSVQGIIDLAAMPGGEVIAILTRLAELGIVSLP